MKKLEFHPLFKSPPPDDARIPSLQTLALKTLVDSQSIVQQDPKLTFCAGSLKQDLVKEYKSKNPKFKHIYDTAEALFGTTSNIVAFHDITDPQQILIPFAEFKKNYQGEFWHEIEFWALQQALHCAVDMSVYCGFAGDKPFAMMPYVEVFDQLLRQKYKTVGFVNGLFMAMLQEKNTGLLLPYAKAMKMSLDAHPQQAFAMIPLLQLIPNCMLCTVDDLTLWLDFVISQSTEDVKQAFCSWYQEKHESLDGFDAAFSKMCSDEVEPLCMKLFSESEQIAPEAQISHSAQFCSVM